MIRKVTSSVFRAGRRVRSEAGYFMRRNLWALSHPGIQLSGKIRIEKDCIFELGRGATLRVHDCYIGRNVRITVAAGASVDIDADFIGPYTFLVARESIAIGSGSKLGEFVIVRDANHDHSVPLTEMRFVSAPIQVGQDVWIGARATVLLGVKIGDSSTVGAASVVTSDVSDGQIVAGVPARPIAARRTSSGRESK